MILNGYYAPRLKLVRLSNVYPTQHEKLKEDRSVLSATMM